MQREPDSVAERTVQAVATTTKTDPTDLPPLYDAIDPDALVGIVDGMTRGEVVFTYADCRVTVTGEGSITVEPDGVGYRGAESRSPVD
ncbi:MAG: HalOD1 output domain-containing protein [Halolamina sp.]